MNVKWKMGISQCPVWKPSDLPEILKPFYVLVPPDGVINGSPSHHLMGYYYPSKEVLDSISETFNTYMHLRMPFGQKSYVWSSYGDERDPVRCHAYDAIDHFHCDL